jgi:SAM-dependent methyltransferase
MHRTPHHPGRFLVGALALAAAACLPVSGAEKKPQNGAAEKAAAAPARKNKAPDVVYVPTPQSVVDRMLELAEVKAGDVVYDLGCGDGRIVVTAAKKFGVKAIGYDIDPQRVKEARENVRQAGVEHLVRIEEADVFTLDLSGASVVTLYLLPSLNVRLMPQLAKLKPGSRIVSHNFDMRGAKPLLVEHVQRKPDDSSEGFYDEDMDHTVYKWVVPWEPELPPEKKN